MAVFSKGDDGAEIKGGDEFLLCPDAFQHRPSDGHRAQDARLEMS